MLKFKLLFIFVGIFQFSQAQFTKTSDDWRAYILSLSKNFHWQVDSSFQQDQAQVELISFHSPNGLKIKGLLIRPIKAISVPLIIYQHRGEANKAQFFAEMLTLAQNQLMCISLDAPNLAEVINPNFNKNDITYIYREAVINLQLVLAYVLEKYPVQKTKIAMVGHSFGANVGVILAAMEAKINYLVAIACPPNITEMYRQINEANIQKINEATPKERFDIWLTMLNPFNTENHIRKIKTKTLFQFANLDEYISPESAQNLYEMFPEPKEIKFYDCKHVMNLDAEQERITWLLSVLKNY